MSAPDSASPHSVPENSLADIRERWPKGREPNCLGGDMIAMDVRWLIEQYQAALDALKIVVAYDDAVIEWDSMKAHDPATAKAKQAVSDRATELNKQAFAAARAVVYPASEPGVSDA